MNNATITDRNPRKDYWCFCGPDTDVCRGCIVSASIFYPLSANFCMCACGTRLTTPVKIGARRVIKSYQTIPLVFSHLCGSKMGLKLKQLL